MHRLAALGVSVAAALVVATPAQAAPTESVDIEIKVAKGDKNKKTGGVTTRTTFRISDGDGGKPAPLTHTTLRFPKGGKINAKLFKKCKLADLKSKGPNKGCPKDSQVGKGTARGDARPFISDIGAQVKLFNGDTKNGNPTLLVWALPEIGPIIIIQTELKQNRRGRYGYVIDADVPPIPTLPNQPNASPTFFDVTTIDRVVRKRRGRRVRKIHYIEAPIVCNGTFFLLDGAFSYEGGITNTVYENFTVNGGPRCP